MTLEEALLSFWNEDRERCGLIIDNTVVEFENVSDESKSEFAFYSSDVDFFLETHGLTNDSVVGVWHTHPTNEARPSELDLNGWPRVEGSVRYFIVAENIVTEWEIDDSGEAREITCSGSPLVDSVRSATAG